MKLRSGRAATLQLLAVGACFVAAWASGSAGCGSEVQGPTTAGAGAGAGTGGQGTSSAVSGPSTGSEGASTSADTSTTGEGPTTTTAGPTSSSASGGCVTDGGNGDPTCPVSPPSFDSPCPTEGQCCDYVYFWCDHNGGNRRIIDVYTCTMGTWQ